MDLITDPEQLRGWLPIRVKWLDAEPSIHWCRVGDVRFTESFFDQTIDRVLTRPFNLMFRRRTSIDALRIAAGELDTIQPTGFIFHVSRCGSTLVSRMLASLPQNVVMSEASPLDWIIRAEVRRPEITDEERVNWLRWMVTALAQKRTGDAEHFFVKFDAWHMLYFDVIERAFPDVPWIFLYRDPVEVLVSHQKQRGAATLPGMVEHRIEGLTNADAFATPLDEFPALLLSKIMAAALHHADRSNGLLINYNRLPGAAAGEMLEHFGLKYSDDDIAAMLAAAGTNAKRPAEAFVPDADDKRRAATAEVRSFADKLMMPEYVKLENAARQQEARART